MRFIQRWQRFDVSGKGRFWSVYALGMIILLSVLLHPAKAQKGRIRILAQTGSSCGVSDPTQHCTVLNWVGIWK